MDPTRPDPAGSRQDRRPPAADATVGAGRRLRGALAVGAVPALMAVLYAAHVEGANGPAYWRWPWQSLGFWWLAGPAALCALPFAAAQWLHGRRPDRAAGPLLLVTATTFALQVTLAAMQWRAPSLERIWRIVASPGAHSYLNEALRQASNPGLLATWVEEMPRAVVHAHNKPVGPVLYWRTLLDVMGPAPGIPFEVREAALTRVALSGGLLLALLGALACPATWWLVRALTGRRDAAFAAASGLAFAPGLVLFTPEFDQAFPLFTAALLGTWALALARDRLAWAAATGAALAGMVLFTWVTLVLGVAVVGLALVHGAGVPGAGRLAPGRARRRLRRRLGPAGAGGRQPVLHPAVAEPGGGAGAPAPRRRARRRWDRPVK